MLWAIHSLIRPTPGPPIAASGVAFTNTYCQNPICTPSRASFLTGRYPSSINANINGACNLPEHCTLITKRLADAGYYCGLVGKLHITSAWNDYEPRMDDGYSYFCYNLASGHYLNSPGNPYVEWLNQKGVDWHDIFTSDEKARLSLVPLRRSCGAAANRMAGGKKPSPFIRERSACEQPWLLSVNCYDPHPPYDAPAHLVEKYLARNLPDPIYSDADLALNNNLKDFFFSKYGPSHRRCDAEEQGVLLRDDRIDRQTLRTHH